MRRWHRRAAQVALLVGLIAAPAVVHGGAADKSHWVALSPQQLALLNRVTWGANASGARQVGLIQMMYKGTQLAPKVDQGFSVRDELYKAMTEEMQEANRHAVTARGFELAARRIGSLMKERFNLGFVDVGGWDTHVNQGNANGYLAGRLGELGRALSGFAESMGPVWHDTVVIVISEFGRTFRENGDRGTDHGHGSAYWVLGGAVKGGRIVGEQAKVEQGTLFQNRDFQVLNDYRAVLGGLFGRMFSLPDDRVQRIFANAAPKDLALV